MIFAPRWGKNQIRLVATIAASLLYAGSVSAHPHNSVEVIEPPIPEFPEGVIAPGRCDVRFALSNYTEIRVLSVECSDLVFCDSARDSVEEAKLTVIDNDGVEGPGNSRNAVYPLQFAFGIPSENQSNWIAAQPLFSCDQSQMF